MCWVCMCVCVCVCRDTNSPADSTHTHRGRALFSDNRQLHSRASLIIWISTWSSWSLFFRLENMTIIMWRYKSVCPQTFWDLCPYYLWVYETFFTADILTCHSKKSTGVTNGINDGSVLFRCPSESWQSGKKMENGTQPSLILLFTDVLFLLRRQNVVVGNVTNK